MVNTSEAKVSLTVSLLATHMKVVPLSEGNIFWKMYTNPSGVSGMAVVLILSCLGLLKLPSMTRVMLR